MSFIKHIDLILENCDSIRIDGKHIGFFVIDNIRKRTGVLGCNSFGTQEIADEIYLEISPDANKEYHPLGIPSEKEIPFERLSKYHDITSIDIITDDQTLRYYTNWTGDSDYENAAQTSTIGKNGCFYLAIAKRKTAQEYFADDLEKPFEPWEYGFNGWLRYDWGDNPTSIEASKIE